MVQLPIAVYSGFDISTGFVVAFAINTAVHAFVDDLKANRKRINLIADQTIHLLQIAVTAIALI